jgi:hypothetical protein
MAFPITYLTSENYTSYSAGLVPYTGATGNVDLGTNSLTANDLIINHASGSGVAASITKGGNGEALTVVKSSGSGNVASFTGGNTFISTLTTPTINGVSGLLSFGSTDRVSVGNYATPSSQRIFTVGQDTAWITIGSLPTATSFGGIWINQSSITQNNACIYASITDVTFQAPTTLFLRAQGVNVITLKQNTFSAIPFGSGTGAVENFTFTKPTNTGQTASTAIAGWSYTGNSRTWLTGNITAQNENIWGAVTYNFGGASVITKAIGNVFNAPVAGTNCTITANFAAQFNGNVEINGSISNSGGLPNLGAAATPYGTFFITNIRGATDLTLGSGYSTSGDRGLIMFASTRNIVIQNGGTFVDNGYRLDVQGTTRITGNTTIGSTGQLFQFSTSANNPSYTQTGATGSSIYTVSGSLQVRMQSFSGGQNWLFATGGRFLYGTSDNQPIEFYTNNTKRFEVSAIGSMVFYNGATFQDATNLTFQTTTGTKIGTATTQKIAFWNTTPIVQPANTVSLNGVLETTGLMASGSTISTINKPLVAGVNTTPRTGTATDGVTSVLGDLKTWNDNYFSGEVLYNEVSGEALSFGQLCYRDRFGNWLKALANVASETSYNMLGICLRTTAEQGTPISILTKGYTETTYIVGGNTGDPLYISESSAGSITNATPTGAGNVVRLVGNVFWDSSSQTNGKWILSFSPDNTWIEL